MKNFNLPLTKNQIEIFLKEDLKEIKLQGDITTHLISGFKNKEYNFYFISKNKNPFVLCGVESFEMIISEISQNPFKITYIKKDGDLIKKDDIILKGRAFASEFLIAERISLNLIQHLSAVSTKTKEMIEKLDDSKIKILDTRKTIPGLRILQKYAVKCGGGQNHRFGLYDMIMIKDNHITAAGGIEEAIKFVTSAKKNTKIEVECKTLEEVKKAAKQKLDVIMLDNMSVSQIKKASEIIRKNSSAKIEVSGGVSISNISKYKGLEIDFISSGALTHSVKAVDISAKIEP